MVAAPDDGLPGQRGKFCRLLIPFSGVFFQHLAHDARQTGVKITEFYGFQKGFVIDNLLHERRLAVARKGEAVGNHFVEGNAESDHKSALKPAYALKLPGAMYATVPTREAALY